MGRAARHAETTILAGAKQLSAEVGPQKLTIAAVAARTGAPVGSIYHRYASRDAILAAIWLDLVEGFQHQFLSTLNGADPLAAGLAAVRFTCAWVRQHPAEARLMLLYRREDFAAERWPQSYRRRAAALATTARVALEAYAVRLLGSRRPAELRRVRFALVDLPTAALKRDIEAGAAPDRTVEALLLESCKHTFRHGRRGARISRA